MSRLVPHDRDRVVPNACETTTPDLPPPSVISRGADPVHPFWDRALFVALAAGRVIKIATAAWRG